MNVKDTFKNLIGKVTDEDITKADERLTNWAENALTLVVTSTINYLRKTKILATLRNKFVTKKAE